VSARADAMHPMLFREVVRWAALPPETEATMLRSCGFYHDDDQPWRQPLNAAALTLALVIVSAVGVAIVLLVRALLLAPGDDRPDLMRWLFPETLLRSARPAGRLPEPAGA
jgi:hypothetical protein